MVDNYRKSTQNRVGRTSPKGPRLLFQHTTKMGQGPQQKVGFRIQKKDEEPATGVMVNMVFEITRDRPHSRCWTRLPDIGLRIGQERTLLR